MVFDGGALEKRLLKVLWKNVQEVCVVVALEWVEVQGIGLRS